MPARTRAAAGASAAHHALLGLPAAGSKEDRQHPRRPFTLAVLAFDGRVGLAHRAQRVELGTAVGAEIFVEGHMPTSAARRAAAAARRG